LFQQATRKKFKPPTKTMFEAIPNNYGTCA